MKDKCKCGKSKLVTSKTCKECSSSRYGNKVPWIKGKIMSKDYCDKLSNAHKGKKQPHNEIWNKNIKRGTISKMKQIEHHIYLKENSDKVIKISQSTHTKLHLYSYNYLVKLGLIDNYLKWFKKNIGGF